MKNKTLALMASLLAVSVNSAFAMDENERKEEGLSSPTMRKIQPLPLSQLIKFLQEPQPVESVLAEAQKRNSPKSSLENSPKQESPTSCPGTPPERKTSKTLPATKRGSARRRKESLESPGRKVVSEQNDSPLRKQKNSLGNSLETANPLQEIRDPSTSHPASLKENVLQGFSRFTSSTQDRKQSPVQERKNTTTSPEDMRCLRYTTESEQPNSFGSPEPSSGRERQDSFASPGRGRAKTPEHPHTSIRRQSANQREDRAASLRGQKEGVRLFFLPEEDAILAKQILLELQGQRLESENPPPSSPKD